MASDSICSLHYQANSRALDFLTVKHACPKGLYLVPLPEDAAVWEAVLFVRHGPYYPAVLRFQIRFPASYPHRPPEVLFMTDVFHPLITPLTTYTHSNQDAGTDTISASDQDRLAPGSFSLRHGFPSWYPPATRTYDRLRDNAVFDDDNHADGDEPPVCPANTQGTTDATDAPPHILELLYYLRAALTREELLDSISQDNAANPSAWHAWQSYRARPTPRSSYVARNPSHVAATTPVKNAIKQQPGGARSPAEWNWDGVWEDRVRKSIQTSIADQTIYKTLSPPDELIRFVDLDPETVQQAVQWRLGGAEQRLP